MESLNTTYNSYPWPTAEEYEELRSMTARFWMLGSDLETFDFVRCFNAMKLLQPDGTLHGYDGMTYQLNKVGWRKLVGFQE